jgi:hypothetical protein
VSDLWTVNLDAIYTTIGVEAFLVSAPADVFTVVDKTAGIEVPMAGGQAQMPTIIPAAAVRVYELAEYGITDPRTLINSMITFNDVTWKIINVAPKPTPSGEASGEVYLHLRK